jgi:ribosome-associated toxin RatA of RatAB toxin-antitoxin module
MSERTGSSTTSSTTVLATPAAVLAVISDVEAYPEWAAGVQQVKVLSTDELDRPKQVRFVVDNGPIKDTYVLDYTWSTAADGTGSVSWTLVRADIIRRLDGAYRLLAAGEGTEVTYELTVDIKIPMLGMLKRKAEKVIIDTALKELKKRAEG